jgi:SOS response regulatory protein OraA/RecX
MRSQPRKSDDEAELYAAALRALVRRAHSTFELRQGGRRIAQELRKRGVPDQHINAAIAQVFTDVDEAAMVRKAIERRTRTARGPFDQRKMASLYRTLLRAGFDPGLIRRELRAFPLPEAVEEMPG